MKRLCAVLLALCVSCVGPSLCLAGKTAGEMVMACQLIASSPDAWRMASIEQATESSRCSGYVAGIADLGQATRMVCPPNGWSYMQAIKIFLNYANANPQRLNEPAPSVILASLINTFPCQTGAAQ
jgi:hypothetical protein